MGGAQGCEGVVWVEVTACCSVFAGVDICDICEAGFEAGDDVSNRIGATVEAQYEKC